MSCDACMKRSITEKDERARERERGIDVKPVIY